MKGGFVRQVKFQNEEDKERLRNRLKALADKLNFLGYKIHLEDEITWYNKGVGFLKEGKIEEAVECLDKAI
jgi:hypothetical protein